ncbi:MAG: hypothetical protein Q8R82_18775 [Hyphomonadaceae bacterium]|nr:hypothetical protein [Hyphomonadaceae bacterium]
MLCRGLGIAVSVMIGAGQTAAAQASANAIAGVETALFCSAIMQRADELANFGLYGPNDMRASDSDLDTIEARYAANIDAGAQAAGYSAEKLAERRAVHRQRVGQMITATVVLQTKLCVNPVTLQATDTNTPPKGAVALALGGRTKTDVLYVDMNSLNRLGPVVSGWQLYVFKADQTVGGKPSKGQWTRFYADCLNPTMAIYGSVGLADLRADKPYTADTRAAAKIQDVQPNTFGAVTWMLACGVTQPGATQASLAAAADHAPGQFVQ